MTEEQLKNLLQQRSTPKAPEGYYEDLLANLHQQQRADLLQRPLWRIAIDRISSLWGQHSVSTPTYAFALASITAIGITSILAIKPAATSDGATLANRSVPTAKLDILPAAAIQEGGGSILEQKKPKQPREALPGENR